MKRIARHLSYANVAATLAVVLALSGAAVAATGGFVSGGRLQACVTPEGQLKLLKSGKKCKKGQSSISWNQSGPKGSAGAQGPAGATGAPESRHLARAQRHPVGGSERLGSPRCVQRRHGRQRERGRTGLHVQPRHQQVRRIGDAERRSGIGRLCRTQQTPTSSSRRPTSKAKRWRPAAWTWWSAAER